MAVYGQVPGVQEEKKYIGFTFSPDYWLRSPKPNPNSQAIASFYNNFYIPQFSFRTGLVYGFNLNHKVSLEAALLYTNKSERTPKLTYVSPTPTSPREVTIIFHDIYLDIPLKIKYFLMQKQDGLYIAGGFSPNKHMFTKQTSNILYNDGHTGTTTYYDIPKLLFNPNLILGVGFSSNITKKIFFKIEPTGRFLISSFMGNQQYGTYIYSFGIDVGLFYKLK